MLALNHSVNLSFINAIFLWIYGIAMGYHVIIHWNDSRKKNIRLSELVYTFAFFIIGFMVMNLFNNQTYNRETVELLQRIMFLAYSLMIVYLIGFNIIPEIYKIKKNPELIDNDPIITRNYREFLEILEKKYSDENRSADIVKDLSRKALHFVLLFIIIIIHEISIKMSSKIYSWGISPLVFRNYIYLLAAMFFIFMFTTADLIRIDHFEYLPNWARKWYSKSLEHRTEAYTLISSVPFLLTLLLFLNQDWQILLGAAWVSCVADATASVVGKSFGKHKMSNFGNHPRKSFEGLITGMFVSIIGIWLMFQIYPYKGLQPWLQFTIALVIGLVFLYIDAFATWLVDNILNTLIPGALLWFVLNIFI